jgi:hypothetical protein
VEKEERRLVEDEERREEGMRNSAALQIQRIERGRQGRQRYGHLREEERRYEEGRQRAATDIQRIQRGRQGRRRVGTMRAQRVETEANNARIRAKQAILRAREEHEAAKRIQSLERGRQARRRVSGIRRAGEEEDARRREGQDLRSRQRRERREHRGREQAAVKIQSLQRGRAARKEMQRRRLALQQRANARRRPPKSQPSPRTPASVASSSPGSTPESTSDVPLEIFARFRGIEQVLPLVSPRATFDHLDCSSPSKLSQIVKSIVCTEMLSWYTVKRRTVRHFRSYRTHAESPYSLSLRNTITLTLQHHKTMTITP